MWRSLDRLAAGRWPRTREGRIAEVPGVLLRAAQDGDDLQDEETAGKPASAAAAASWHAGRKAPEGMGPDLH